MHTVVAIKHLMTTNRRRLDIVLPSSHTDLKTEELILENCE